MSVQHFVEYYMETCDARNHRWSDAQLKDFQRHLSNDPEIVEVLRRTPRQ